MRASLSRITLHLDTNKEAALPEYYEIKVKGHIDSHWSNWFAGLNLAYLEGDVTLISGPLPDQAALHGLLERIRDLNLRLISVNCGCPSSPDPDHKNKE
jgi:hypothetical protein